MWRRYARSSATPARSSEPSVEWAMRPTPDPNATPPQGGEQGSEPRPEWPQTGNWPLPVDWKTSTGTTIPAGKTAAYPRTDPVDRLPTRTSPDPLPPEIPTHTAPVPVGPGWVA